LALRASDSEQAEAALRLAADLGDESGNRWISAFARTQVYWLWARQGRIVDGLRGFAEVIDVWYRGGDWANQWLSMRHLLGILVDLGAHQAAAVLHGALVAAGAAAALPFEPGDAKEFMTHYVRWNVEVIEKEPLDIFAHPTWLPAPLDSRAEELWTEERMKPIIRALQRTGTAVEIDSAFQIPSLAFLRMAKDARLKFSFGSNSGSGPARAIDFCVERAKAMGLTASDMFAPAKANKKPFLRRKV
jgi:hypothetical protein